MNGNLIREASDLSATIDKNQNQFRDRTRQASQDQIRKISENLDFRYLGNSPTMDFGSPTLASDGKTVIGGNGRLAGIKDAYKQDKAENYKTSLIQNAEQFGFTAEQISEFEQPVLIRKFNNENINIKEASILSNEGGGLTISALEQAQIDSERLPDISLFEFNDRGEINNTANRNLISQWVGQFPQNQRGALQDSNGLLSQTGVNRLQNAILYKAYGNTPSLRRAIESTHQESLNINKALAQSASTVANSKAKIAYGSLYDLDIAEDLTLAADLIEQIKSEGKSVEDWLAQESLLTDVASNEVARNLVQYFNEHIRSSKAIRDLIQTYYSELDNLGNPNQNDIFGDKTIPSKQELLRKVINEQTTQANPDQRAEPAEQTSPETSPSETALQHQQQSPIRTNAKQGNTESRANAEVTNFRQPETTETVSSQDENAAQTHLEQAQRAEKQEREIMFMRENLHEEVGKMDVDTFIEKYENQADNEVVVQAIAQEWNMTPADVRGKNQQDWLDTLSDFWEESIGERIINSNNEVHYSRTDTASLFEEQSEPRNSQSPIKSVEANIRRGKQAMNQAITEKRTVHRAMYRNDLEGWVDFEWGDEGKTKPNGKTQGAMGIAHILEARQRKDGMSYQDVVEMLTGKVINTIAKGKLSKIYESKIKRVRVYLLNMRETA